MRHVPSSRSEVLATTAVIGVMIGAVLALDARRTLGPRATAAQCEALLSRYVEHLAHAAEPEPAASAIAAQRDAARAQARESPAFARCPRELSHDAADCALGAHSADEFERCLQ